MLCNANPRNKENKNKKPKNNGHKEYSNKAQGPRKPRKIRDTESRQLLDEVSQTYFCQEVW